MFTCPESNRVRCQPITSEGSGVDTGVLYLACPPQRWSCCPSSKFCTMCQTIFRGRPGQALPRAFEITVLKCQRALPVSLLSNRIGGIMLFWVSLKQRQVRNRRALCEWDHSSCFACRPRHSPLLAAGVLSTSAEITFWECNDRS